jgi:DNA-directed RNA polymerase subunit RPC12/RpoP
MKNPVKKHVRHAVLERDGFRCQYCGRAGLSLEEGTVDHIIPISLDGHHKAENLRAACRPCNSRRGPKSIEEFRFLLTLADAGLHGIISATQAAALQEFGINLHLPQPFVFYFERAAS